MSFHHKLVLKGYEELIAGATPSHTELYVPRGASYSEIEVDVSIVVPALNEEITIGEFIDWCKEGLELANISGEILIIDSSIDNTPIIALEKGAFVLRTPKRGLGQAYIDAIPYIRGKLIIMGDCDQTYDFRDLNLFVNSYRSGFEYIMGSRFLGSIEKGAMPKLHQYFGTPLTTWILNKIYDSNFTDIHCGMRGITKNALISIALTSKGWEYASEMVLKSARLKLKTSEVPVKFYKDRDGRVSHHKRVGFLSPWIAGWMNLKVMLAYSPETFLLKPGLFILGAGIILTIFSSLFHGNIGPVILNVNGFMFGLTLAVSGYALYSTGIISRNLHGFRQSCYKGPSYNSGMLISFILIFSGALLCIHFLILYINNSFKLVEMPKEALMGMMLILIGIQTFSFTIISELCRRVSSKMKNEI